MKRTTAQINMYFETPLRRAVLKPIQQKILHKCSTWRIQSEPEFLPALHTMSYNTLIWRLFWFCIYRQILPVNCFQGELFIYNFPPHLPSYLLVHLPLTWTLIKNGVFRTNSVLCIFIKKLQESGLLIMKHFYLKKGGRKGLLPQQANKVFSVSIC